MSSCSNYTHTHTPAWLSLLLFLCCCHCMIMPLPWGNLLWTSEEQRRSQARQSIPPAYHRHCWFSIFRDITYRCYEKKEKEKREKSGTEWWQDRGKWGKGGKKSYVCLKFKSRQRSSDLRNIVNSLISILDNRLLDGRSYTSLKMLVCVDYLILTS